MLALALGSVQPTYDIYAQRIGLYTPTQPEIVYKVGRETSELFTHRSDIMLTFLVINLVVEADDSRKLFSNKRLVVGFVGAGRSLVNFAQLSEQNCFEKAAILHQQFLELALAIKNYYCADEVE